MEPEAPVWFAMSAPYRRELKAKELLDSKGIENYVAMHYVLKEKGGRKARVLEPVIHNLIFAHCTKNRIQEVKTGVDYLQYLTMVEDGRRVPKISPPARRRRYHRQSGGQRAPNPPGPAHGFQAPGRFFQKRGRGLRLYR